MAEDPQGMIDVLKVELERVRKTPELDAAVRLRLGTQLEMATAERGAADRGESRPRSARTRKFKPSSTRANRSIASWSSISKKPTSCCARFESLLDERQFRAAEEEADRAHDLPPALRNTPEPGDAWPRPCRRRCAHTMGYVYDMKELVRRRHKGVVESLYATEVAHIPQSDEPPIIYPSAEEWMLKTERRKKYAEAVSLYQPGSSEEKIYRELGNTTDLEFADTPLSDVVDYIKNKHDIEIQLDSKGLTDAAVDPSAPVTAA